MFAFLKPTIVAITAFAVFVAINEFYVAKESHVTVETSVKTVAGETDTYEKEDTILGHAAEPHPELSPKDVVRIQLQSLRSKDFEEGIRQCFRFASPANRDLTGPADRFGKLIKEPPYRILLSAADTIIGDPMKRTDGRIQIIVTAISNTEAQSFAWTLAKQTDAPFQTCWMTDSVVAIAKKTKGKVQMDV